MPYMNLKPTQVILDPQNPRLPDGTSSDREAINRLLDEGADALINLARDMASSGQSNPAELPIAVKDGSRYLVLEGNRRFAALKLLNDPMLADSERHQRAFRRAASLGKPPDRIYTLVATSREDADRWIVLRHTGQNNGKGIRSWSSEQAATYRRRSRKTVDSGTIRSITIADELEEVYATDTEIVNLVRTVRRSKLTNIGRFFAQDVLNSLHLEIRSSGNTVRERVLFARHDADQLRDFFAWAMSYIEKNTVDAYKNAKLRSDAILKVRHLIPSLTQAHDHAGRLAYRAVRDASTDDRDHTTNSDSSYNRGDASESAEEKQQDEQQAQGKEALPSAGTGNRETRKVKREAKPERYLFQGLRLPYHNARIQRLLRECRDLEVDQSAGVCCVMARVLVELSVSSPEALGLSGALEAEPLRIKLIKMLKYLDPDIEHPVRRDKQLAQAFLEADTLGIQYLNSFVHNPTVYPDAGLARRFSSAFRPFLERVDEAL